MKDELDLSEASRLLSYRRPTLEADRWPHSHREELRRAVEANESSVTLDGRVFEMVIGTDSFHLSPLKGFAPCGYIQRKWLYETWDD